MEKIKFNNLGQWELTKSNEVKPFGANIYDSKANLGRKVNRTGEEVAGVGRNAAVHRYTTSNASVNSAREANEAKRQASANKAAPVKTKKDIPTHEIAAMEAKANAKKNEMESMEEMSMSANGQWNLSKGDVVPFKKPSAPKDEIVPAKPAVKKPLTPKEMAEQRAQDNKHVLDDLKDTREYQ